MIYKREEYVEENRSDTKFPIKHIDVMTPADGGPARYIGQVALGVQTPVGVQQIPVSFEIEASSVEEAFRRFEEHAMPKLEEARRQIEEELQRLRQQASSRIVRPSELGLQGGGGGNVIDFGKFKR